MYPTDAATAGGFSNPASAGLAGQHLQNIINAAAAGYAGDLEFGRTARTPTQTRVLGERAKGRFALIHRLETYFDGHGLFDLTGYAFAAALDPNVDLSLFLDAGSDLERIVVDRGGCQQIAHNLLTEAWSIWAGAVMPFPGVHTLPAHALAAGMVWAATPLLTTTGEPDERLATALLRVVAAETAADPDTGMPSLAYLIGKAVKPDLVSPGDVRACFGPVWRGEAI